jgi:hypothetical protein
MDLINKIYELVEAPNVPDFITYATIIGNRYMKDDETIGFYVKLDYIINKQTSLTLYLYDDTKPYIIKNDDMAYLELNQNDNNHEIAILLVNLLNMDAKQYLYLDRTYFPTGN